MKKFIMPIALIAVFALSQFTYAQEQEEPAVKAEKTAEEQQAEYEAWASEFLAGLNKQTGMITLPGSIALLNVPDGFFYLSPVDSKKILEEAWGNPPTDGGLGMIFPDQYTPLQQETWGVTLEYEEIGYVEDDNANSVDYDDLLDEMRDDIVEENKYRTENGYGTYELLGWAATPYYDDTNKKLHWAKEIHFEGTEQNTLNYNVRILGRKGVLVMNFIATTDQLPEIEANIEGLMEATGFNQGSKYEDFDPDIDEVAAYGIAGLVAGKVIAKTGILLTLLVAFKKFWFLFAAGGIWLWRKIAGNKKEDESAD